MKKLSELFHACAYDVVYQEAGDDVNYAFVEEGSTLYIYFQGSNSISDWVRNFLFPAKPYKDMEITYRVHRGFLAAWKEVEDIVIDKILEKEYKNVFNKRTAKYEVKENFKWKYIYVVGYSHGAALAGLCHECVWYWRPDLRRYGLEGYGFEAPRFYAGWKVKEVLKQRWEHFTVIRCNNDLVTHCPPALFRFCHVGKMLKIKGDISLVHNHAPRCVKAHYPEVVYDALLNFEKTIV